MKLVSVVCHRLRAMTGGAGMFFFFVTVMILCFYSVNAIVNASPPESLSLAVVDLDDSDASSELYERLQSLDGVSLVRLNENEAHNFLARGKIEGFLTIGEGFAEAMKNDLKLPLSYDSASASVSKMAAREIIAGQVVAQRSLERAYTELEQAGIQVSADEIAALLAEFKDNPYPLYRFSTYTPSLATEQTTVGMFAGYPGFIALAAMFIMMTLSQWLAQPDSKRVAKRMAIKPHGAGLSFGADVTLLLSIGIFIIMLAYLCSFSLSPVAVFYLFFYVYCVTGMCLLLAKRQEAGSIDVMAPIITLFTCILGGCFIDLSSLTPVLRMLSFFTPQGQMLYGIGHGVVWPLGLLFVEGTVLLGTTFYVAK